MPLPLAYGEVAELSRRPSSRGWASIAIRLAIDLLAIVGAGSAAILTIIAANPGHG